MLVETLVDPVLADDIMSYCEQNANKYPWLPLPGVFWDCHDTIDAILNQFQSPYRRITGSPRSRNLGSSTVCLEDSRWLPGKPSIQIH
jgi:hypothetical protein